MEPDGTNREEALAALIQKYFPNKSEPYSIVGEYPFLTDPRNIGYNRNDALPTIEPINAEPVVNVFRDFEAILSSQSDPVIRFAIFQSTRDYLERLATISDSESEMYSQILSQPIFQVLSRIVSEPIIQIDSDTPEVILGDTHFNQALNYLSRTCQSIDNTLPFRLVEQYLRANTSKMLFIKGLNPMEVVNVIFNYLVKTLPSDNDVINDMFAAVLDSYESLDLDGLQTIPVQLLLSQYHKYSRKGVVFNPEITNRMSQLGEDLRDPPIVKPSIVDSSQLKPGTQALLKHRCGFSQTEIQDYDINAIRQKYLTYLSAKYQLGADQAVNYQDLYLYRSLGGDIFELLNNLSLETSKNRLICSVSILERYQNFRVRFGKTDDEDYEQTYRAIRDRTYQMVWNIDEIHNLLRSGEPVACLLWILYEGKNSDTFLINELCNYIEKKGIYQSIYDIISQVEERDYITKSIRNMVKTRYYTGNVTSDSGTVYFDGIRTRSSDNFTKRIERALLLALLRHSLHNQNHPAIYRYAEYYGLDLDNEDTHDIVPDSGNTTFIIKL